MVKSVSGRKEFQSTKVVRPPLCEIDETDLVINEEIISPILRKLDRVCFVSAVLGLTEEDNYVRLELSNATGNVVAFAREVKDVSEGDFVFVYGGVRVLKRGGVVSVSKIAPIDTTEVSDLMDYYLVEMISQLTDALQNYHRKDLIAKEGRKHYGDQMSKYRNILNNMKKVLMDKYGVKEEIQVEEEDIEGLEID